MIRTSGGSLAGGDRSDSAIGLTQETWNVGWTLIDARSFSHKAAGLTIRSTSNGPTNREPAYCSPPGAAVPSKSARPIAPDGSAVLWSGTCLSSAENGGMNEEEPAARLPGNSKDVPGPMEPLRLPPGGRRGPAVSPWLPRRERHQKPRRLESFPPTYSTHGR